MLTIYQKSVYLIILNATMILRSIGKTLKDKNKLKQLKRATFEEIESLTEKMDEGSLTEQDILVSIEKISDKFNLSFGQAQKAINVLLKYHFFLNPPKSSRKILNCPLDSIILKELKIKLSLTGMDKEKYIQIQNEIQKISPNRIDFDMKWDKQHLENEGIKLTDAGKIAKSD